MKKALLAIVVVAVLLVPAFNALKNDQTVERKDDFVKLGGMDDTSFSRGNILNMFNGRQTILQFIFSSLFTNFRDGFISKITPSGTQSATTGGIDQSQDDYSGGYAEIYGNRWYAQSFVPKTYMQLTGINIFVEREGLRAFSTGGNGNVLDLNGDIIVEISDSLNGTIMARNYVSGSDISKSMR